MKDLNNILDEIKTMDEVVLADAQARLDNLTKPQGSLGTLETIARRFAAIRRDAMAKVGKKVIFTFAGDHGVCDEGVSAYPSSVTVQMVLNMLSGGAAVNVLARHVGSDNVVVDIGVDHDFAPSEGMVIEKVGRGTKNMAIGPAMTREEALRSIGVGFRLAEGYAGKGYNLFGTGEMGIGNTTPSSAILSVMTGLSAKSVVGRGTGLDEDGMKRKADVISRAIEINRPDPNDPLDVLAKVGGFEIGGIVGLIIGAACKRVPVVVDGFISTAAAMIATALNPAISEYLFYSHLSAESGHAAMLESIGVEPILSLDMRLGEGTGAAVAMSVIEGAVKIMNEMATFESAGVDRKAE